MKNYLKPESNVITLQDTLLQTMYGSEGNNQDPGDGGDNGGSFAPMHPNSWLDKSDRFYGDADE